MSLGLGDSVDGGGGLDMFDSGGEVAGVEAAEDKHENYDAGGDAAGGRKRARSAVDGDVSGGSAKFSQRPAREGMPLVLPEVDQRALFWHQGRMQVLPP